MMATDSKELKMNSENTFVFYFFPKCYLVWRNSYLSVLVKIHSLPTGKLKCRMDKNKPEYLRHFCSLRQMEIGRKLKADAVVIG